MPAGAPVRGQLDAGPHWPDDSCPLGRQVREDLPETRTSTLSHRLGGEFA